MTEEIPYSEKVLQEENARLRAEIQRLKSNQNQERNQLEVSIQSHRVERDEIQKEWRVVRNFLQAFDELRNARFTYLR